MHCWVFAIRSYFLTLLSFCISFLLSTWNPALEVAYFHGGELEAQTMTFKKMPQIVAFFVLNCCWRLWYTSKIDLFHLFLTRGKSCPQRVWKVLIHCSFIAIRLPVRVDYRALSDISGTQAKGTKTPEVVNSTTVRIPAWLQVWKDSDEKWVCERVNQTKRFLVTDESREAKKKIKSAVVLDFTDGHNKKMVMYINGCVYVYWK